MPIITALKPQKNKKRINVHLNGKFGFGIDLDNLVKHNLRVEQTLTEKEVEEIVKKAEFQKTLDKLLRFSTLRPRSKREVEIWFRKHKVHESLHDGLIGKLKKLNLLDDRQFSEWWVKQRTEFRPRGKRALFSELIQKGVERRVIEEVLKNLSLDEGKTAGELLEKRMNRWKRLEPRERRKKMSEFLGRKGFDWGTIKEVVNKFLKD